MPAFTRNDAVSLARHEGGPKVSIVMPLEPPGGDHRNSQIRLRKHIEAAHESLRRLGLRPQDAADVLEPARALLGDGRFWTRSARGMAIYLAPGFSKIVSTPAPPRETCSSGPRFELLPLLGLLETVGVFHVLALSKDEARLLECTHDDVRRVALKHGQEGWQEVLKYKEFEESLQHHTADRPAGDRRGMLHGHGVGEDDEKVALLEYFRLVAEAVDEALGADDRRPLVLSAVDRYRDLYRKASHRKLVEPGVVGGPDHISDKDLRDNAWQLVEPQLHEQRKRSESLLAEASNAGLTAADLPEVVRAASAGRIATLFAAETPRWGLFHKDSQHIEEHDAQRPGDVDLVNEAAVMTLVRDGDVYVGEPELVPGCGSERSACAILRW